MNRPEREPRPKAGGPCAYSPQLLTTRGHVRSIALTALGHVSCVLDTPSGRLKAISDAAVVHLPELREGTAVHAVLLRLRRAAPDAPWHWQLLCCRAVHADGTTQLSIPQPSQDDRA
jgi:hypothetical protein